MHGYVPPVHVWCGGLVVRLEEALVFVGLNAKCILNSRHSFNAVQASSFEIFANNLNVGTLVVEAAKLCSLAHALLNNNIVQDGDFFFQIPLDVNAL
jgi:hypothetical protein